LSIDTFEKQLHVQFNVELQRDANRRTFGSA
jgi:hypothetical protein